MASSKSRDKEKGRDREKIERDERGMIATATQPERALLGLLLVERPSGAPIVESAVTPDDVLAEPESDRLSELAGLAEAAGVEVAGRISQKRSRPHGATLFGSGKVEEIRSRVADEDIEVLVVDCDLSPAQGRNLENALKCRVIDRTELILDIFARRAQTRQARLQVELAQLRYQLPRLKRMWSHLERTGGGIGTRGPGETQLETDKNLARERITLLEKQLDSIRRQKEVEGAGRAEFDLVALVGYTNVGKSALLNALSRPTGRGVLEADMLFATLGATTRKVELGGGRTILLSDTVGLVRRLPHSLVESFHSTLAEVKNADLLLRVVNGSDSELEDKLAAVHAVLRELEVLDRAHLLVINQCDLLSSGDRAALARRFPNAIFTSALTGEGLDTLRAAIVARLDEDAREVRLRLHAGDPQTGRVLARLALHGRLESQTFVQDEETGETFIDLHAFLAPRWWAEVGIATSSTE